MPNQLYLPDWTVNEVTVDDDGAYRITATYDIGPECCPACGGVSIYHHGSARAGGKKFFDAPVHGRQTFIFVRMQRYKCRDCGKTWSQDLPDMDDEYKMTRRCREYIERQCLLKPNVHVADDVGCHEKTVREIGKAQTELLHEQYKDVVRAPRLLGLDELALGAEKKMAFILVDLETSWPVDLLETRESAVIKPYLKALRDREKVEIVTTDMWEPYRQAIRDHLPNALHIIDKWHVVRDAHDAMESARKQYASRLRSHADDNVRGDSIDSPRPMTTKLAAAIGKDLKGSRKIFLRRPFQLNAEEQLRLDGWLKNTPEIKGAYDIKEAFMEIWKLYGVAEADAAMTAWEKSIPPHLRSLFAPLVRHLQWYNKKGEGWRREILNYFATKQRYTNARTEARNRVIKMINRLGAGYSFDAIRARALHGKRPGRIKLEKEAEAKKLYTTCYSCKGYFVHPVLMADDPVATHIVPFKKPRRSQNPLPEEGQVMCPQCYHDHTKHWFSRDPSSPQNSE